MKLDANQIIRYVEENKEEALRCLQEILRVPSVTGDEEAVSKIFEKWMTDNGLEVNRVYGAPNRPNLLSEWKGTMPGKRFIFNGHMDVFPPDPKDPGKFGPWSGVISDGHVYGRGAADMKGGDAGALMAVIFLKRLGFDPKGSVLLSWMCDEENGSKLGAQYLLNHGYLRADFGLCMEPCDGRLIPKHGGILRGRVTYTAEAQHTAAIYEYGDNALEKAINVIQELKRINQRLLSIPADGMPSPHLTVSVLNAGEAPNVHPSKAVFWFDRRLVPGEGHDEALREIVQVLDSFKQEDPSYEYKLEITNNRPLLDIPYNDPFIKLVAESYREVMGEDIVIAAKPGGSDASWIRKVTGIPIPNLGAANGYSEMGKPDEKIPVQRYLDFIKVYMMVVVNALS